MPGEFQGGFFTLTELQERLNIEDRKNLRRLLAREGVPLATLGRETYIAAASFVEWIRENEVRKSPKGDKPADA